LCAMTTEEDVISDYYTSLQELECNSKPHINMLTMLAEESQRFAPKIVQLVESHIQKVTTNQKLPVLYLIDSIVKNCPDTQYKELFSKNLINIFVHVFDQVDEKTRQALYRLRTTWPNIFPASKLYGIDIKVHEIDPAWPLQNPNQLKASVTNPVNSSGSSSSSSTKHVHVNPKFIDQKGQKVSEHQEIPEGMFVSSEGQITAEKVRCEELVRLKEELQKTRENMIASVGGPLRINKKPVDLSVRDIENKEKLSSSERVSLKDNPILRSTSKGSTPLSSSKENDNFVESDGCSVESFQSISSYVVCDEHDSLSPHSQLPSESPDQPFISVDEEEAGESSDDSIVVVDIVEMDDEPPSKVTNHPVTNQSHDEKLPNQVSTRSTEYSKKSLHDTKKFSSSRRSSERRDRRRRTRSPDYSPRSSVEKRSRHSHRSRQIDRDGRGRRFSRDERSRSPFLSPVGRRRRSPPVRRRYDSDRSRLDKSHTSSSSSSRSNLKKGSSSMMLSGDVRESGRSHGDSKKSRLHNEETSLPMPVAKKERSYKPPPVPVDLEEPKAPLSSSSLFGNENDQERGLGVDGLKFPPVPPRPAASAVSVGVNPMDAIEYRSRSPAPLVTPMTTPVNSALENNRAIIFQRAQKQLADGILNQREYDDLIRDLTDVIGRVRPPDAPMNSVRSMIVGDVWNPEVSVNSKTLGSAGRLVTPIQAPAASSSGASLLALPEQEECKAPMSIEIDLSESKTSGPSNDRIFVDGHGYEVRYIDEVAVIERNGLPHRISFTGCAKEVIVDGIAYNLAFGESRVITLDGQSVMIRFGAPARELYFGNVPLRGIFGGPPIFIKVNGVKHSILLGGPPPEVKIDTEPSYELLRFLHSGHMSRRGMMRQDVKASVNIGKRLQNNNRCEPVANVEIPKPPTVTHINAGSVSHASTSNNSAFVNVSNAGAGGGGGGGGASAGIAPPQMTPDAIRALLNRIKQVGLLPDNQQHSVIKPSTAITSTAAIPMPVTTWFPDDETVERRKEPTTELKTFNMKYLKIRYQSLIDALYQNKIQCSTCGMRFAVGDSQKYSKHLDWHFKMNRREKAGITASSRPWYLASEDWINYEEFGEDISKKVRSSVFEANKDDKSRLRGFVAKTNSVIPATDEEQICQVCNETFEQFWDGDDEVWKLRNAMLVDGKVYHPLCYQDAGIESTSSSSSVVNNNIPPTCLEEKKKVIGAERATVIQTEKSEVKLMKEVVKLEEQSKNLQTARLMIKPTLPCESLVKSILSAIKGSSEEVVRTNAAPAATAEKVDQC
ncbi:Polyadenylation and cleavage factor -like protein 11, partial [Trichinella pseudospiralis]